MRKKFLVFLIAFQFFSIAFAQDIGIGEWRDHLAYKYCIAVDYAGPKVYCATPYSIFYYNIDDNSVNRQSKVNGLSDVNINTIRYSEQFKMLIIAYTNANIDLLMEDGIINISDIKRKPIYGNKVINNITFYGNYAYLSCGFGIVVIDLVKKEIKDTYYIGPGGNPIDVLDLTCDGNKFYAATDNGIYVANLNGSNLANYANWTKDMVLPNADAKYNCIVAFKNKIFTNLQVAAFNQDTVFVFDGTEWKKFDTTNTNDVLNMRVTNNYLVLTRNYSVDTYNASLALDNIIWNYNPGTPEPTCAIRDGQDNYWIADRYYGLVKFKDWQCEKIVPNGPGNSDVFSMAIAGSSLYVAPGGVNSAWGNVWNTKGVYSFVGNTWYTLKEQNPSFDTLYDILAVAIDPSDYNHVYAASYARGLVEIRSGIITNVFDANNSALVEPTPFYHWLGIGGLTFDSDNNLWMVNSGSNNLLKVLKPDGTWLSFSMVPYLSQARASDLLVDRNHQVWMLLPSVGGMAVFSDNGTLSDPSDDVRKLITTSVGYGNLPSSSVLSIAEDLDGKIWIGTDKGVGVFYNPENVTLGGNFDAQVITILQDSIAQHLLEFESVTAIAVDGANKKWFGTDKAGAFLMSADGQTEILHFTQENSPLLSNSITSIVIDNKTGEVYFGTANGIISYKNYATKGGETFSNVYAYPNPVREGYTGTIGIKGLVKDATVKITDVSGILIYETVSEGGQAVWNGKNFDGVKAKTGVYFVFCSSEDGTQKLVTKIMVIN
ncbi:MAG: two-component regulator propeller domain-containing protein [Bacteroidota bacterium]